MGIRAVISIGLAALLMGCVSREPDDFLITLEVSIPDVVYDQVRVVKSAGGSGVSERSKRFDAAASVLRTHLAGIYVPRDGSEVTLRVQAILGTAVQAEGRLSISARSAPPDDSVTLALIACAVPYPVADDGGRCERRPDPVDSGAVPDAGTDAGVSVDADVPDTADAGAPDADPADAWMAPACSQVDAGDFDAGPAPVAEQPVGTPACEAYCEAMATKCPEIYATKDHCRLTCTALAWPETGQISGDNLACRTAFATGIALDETLRQRHCRFAAPNSEMACGGHPCVVYCRAGRQLCGEAFPPFATCVDACRARDEAAGQVPRPPSIYVWSLHCRFDWLERAVFDRNLCPWAAPNACGPCRELTLP